MDEFPTSPVVIAIVVAAVGWGIVIYNRLVALRQRSRDGWSGIDVQLRRRAALIPNLVSPVKRYAAHEPCILLTVTVFLSQSQAASLSLPSSFFSLFLYFFFFFFFSLFFSFFF